MSTTAAAADIDAAGGSGFAGGIARWTPSFTSNLVGMLNPFASDESTKAASDSKPNGSDGSVNASGRKRPSLAAVMTDASASGPPSPSKSTNSVSMFAEPDSREISENGSREGSITSGQGRKRSKKSNKPKTCFSICHPPPTSTTRQKLHRRPRSLLQLHKLSPHARPVPAFEVIPSANFSVRLQKAIARVFGPKHGLCQNDLVILKAEKYSKDEEDEEREARDVIGLICRGRKEDGMPPGHAKIYMADGSEWEACPYNNGGYECYSTDEHGLRLKLRWVPKKDKEGTKVPNNFNFSTVSPNSRRHPVIANLSKRGLDINDTYKMPDQSNTTPLASPISTPRQRSMVPEDVDDEDIDEPIQTDERTRTMITVTGIWVAFKENWSPSYRYDNERGCSTSRSASAQNSPSKAVASATASPQLEKRDSIRSIGSGIFRKSSMMSRSHRNSIVSSTSDEGSSTARSEQGRTGRTRADSSATVMVHRAASNRRKNNNQATWRPDLLSPRDQLQETSREDLRDKPPANPRNSAPAIASSGLEPFPEAIPARRSSIASPLLPDENEAGQARRGTSTPSGQASKSVHLQRPASADKRESSATTNTTLSDGVMGQKESSRMPKKKPGWRRLFCGHSDV